MVKKRYEVEIKPRVLFSIDGKTLTYRQLEALAQVQSLSSQTQASRELGIATPVLHRHIKKAEGKLGMALIETTATGTRLTELGERIVSEFGRYQARVKRHDKFTIGCTPITMDTVWEAVTDVEGAEPLFEIYIGDDYLNERLLRLGELDIVLFDDPVNVYMHEERGRYFELFMDTLVHCDRGKKYGRYRYGAQRLGFKHLEFIGKKYEVVQWISDVDSLVESGLSFFINRSKTMDLDLRDAKLQPVQELKHAIMILIVNEDPILDKLITAVRTRYKNKFDSDE
jgi:molybdate transport repressor ModE-like protein